MSKSIIQKHKDWCFVCQIPKAGIIEEHHIFFGAANRKLSEKYGLKVPLCYEHHRGTDGVHGKNGRPLDMKLKRIAQIRFEEKYPHLSFLQIFGKSYI